MRHVEDTVLENAFTGEPAKVQMGLGDDGKPKEDPMTVFFSIKHVLGTTLRFGGSPLGGGTSSEDAHRGRRCLAAIRRAEKSDCKSTLKLEDDDYKWLLGHMDQKGSTILGVYADEVNEAIKGAADPAKAPKSEAKA